MYTVCNISVFCYILVSHLSLNALNFFKFFSLITVVCYKLPSCRFISTQRNLKKTIIWQCKSWTLQRAGINITDLFIFKVRFHPVPQLGWRLTIPATKDNVKHVPREIPLMNLKITLWVMVDIRLSFFMDNFLAKQGL